MSEDSTDLRAMLAAARSAVRDASARSGPASAWESLREYGADGRPGGLRPYSDRAIQEFSAAHAHDPDDMSVVHHLAIAHHARAWDLEIAGDDKAGAEWERALGHWRTLGASREFWSDIRAKLLTCDAGCDPAFLVEFRDNLMTYLLDIHGDFIRYWCEQGNLRRAETHIGIVKRARIPPAAKKRLVDTAYEAMTLSVPDARAQGAFDSAIGVVEQFLSLFPEHLRAMRVHAEICSEWLEGISFQEGWHDMLTVAGRAEPHARRLGAHDDLSDQPLARAALVDLCLRVVRGGWDRGSGYLSVDDQASTTPSDRQAGREALQLCVTWGRLGFPLAPGDSAVRILLPRALNLLAVSLHLDAKGGGAMSPSAKKRGTLYREARSLLEETVALAPDVAVFRQNLDTVRQQLADG